MMATRKFERTAKLLLSSAAHLPLRALQSITCLLDGRVPMADSRESNAGSAPIGDVCHRPSRSTTQVTLVPWPYPRKAPKVIIWHRVRPGN